MSTNTISADKDDLATVAAIGVLAYLSADVIHHAFGHGGACVLTGGTINLLSSIFVDCSVRGAINDLAGPFANLVFGVLTLFLSKGITDTKLKLFLILASAFNLFWFEMQMAFSLVSKTDDWAWAIQQAELADFWRYSLVIVALVAYRLSIQSIAKQMAPYASTESRIRRMMIVCWLAAGAIALATAMLDKNAIWAIFHRALPQSMLLSIGLLFVAKHSRGNSSIIQNTTLYRSTPWIAIAVVMSILSIGLLGHGVPVHF